MSMLNVKQIFSVCLCMAMMFSAIDAVYARTLTVGPGKEFVFPSVAAKFAEDGDVIEIDASGMYLNDHVVWKQNNLTIKGVNGRPHIRNEVMIPNRKGIWVIKGNNVNVSNVEMSGAKVGDRNGAAIRLEGENFHLSDCFIHDNENGILHGRHQPESEIIIDNCEFAFNGKGKKGRTHNIYLGSVGRFILRNSYSHDALYGHLVKSRAVENYILYNRLFEGMASYAIDLPNGGYGLVMGNVIYQGDKTDNSAIVAYGQKKLTRDNNQLEVVYNSFLNDRHGGAFVKVKDFSNVKVVNNIFSGEGKVLYGDGGKGYAENNVHTDVLFDVFSRNDISLKLESKERVVDSAVKIKDREGNQLVPTRQLKDGRVVERVQLGDKLDIGAVEYQ